MRDPNSITTPANSLIEMSLSKDLDLSLQADGTVTFFGALLLSIAVLLKLRNVPFAFWKKFEVNEAEFGLGDQKIKISPNFTDMQIAYKIWVELSTRKIGLEIDLDNDVIFEIYDSWFNFFSVTRDLIKDVPVQHFRRNDTEKIIRLSIEVLNHGLRPHLTKWQARFRKWYEQELSESTSRSLHPQDIQRNFPQFNELQNDLVSVNFRLINYRRKMYELIKCS